LGKPAAKAVKTYAMPVAQPRLLVYLKVDRAFPKLTRDNLMERLAWDRDGFAKLVKVVESRQAKK
jgi:hypothetical protein